MKDLELHDWTLLTWLKNFLGNHWAKNYKKLLKSLQGIGANMSIKVNLFFNIAI